MHTNSRRRLAANCAAARGVVFRYGQWRSNQIEAGGSVAGAQVRSDAGAELLSADAYVVALGSYTPLLLRPLGIRLPVYPAKGYSATLALAETSVAPSVSLTDDGYKIVFSRLGQRLRIAGTAEFNGYNTELNPVRCAALMQRRTGSFPNCVRLATRSSGAGLRPATPSNVPCIGRSAAQSVAQYRSRHPGLDDGLRLRGGDCRPHFRTQAGAGFSLSIVFQ